MTTLDLRMIKDKIIHATVQLPKGEMTVNELAAWMNGYKEALDYVIKILEERGVDERR